MKGLKKLLLVSAIAAAPLAAQAELKAVDDSVLADVSGQSGLVIEAGFGSVSGVDASTGDFYGVDWSGAGITIDAFKWIVDIEGGWDQDSNLGVNVNAGNPVPALGGFIAKDIAIAGAVDMTIDATADLANVIANGGAVAEGDGGIGISFANSNINFKVGDMGVFVEEYDLANVGQSGTVAAQQVSSYGGIEIIGMNIDNLQLVIRGNGL
ncbi:hypothetical protein BTA51_10755 [Hahella sp. CCB-MM4]|uniref:DUF6160 family protein n=1 Tax=Hahella sp. (strain CCB-MM4) TaxID=1926491 RepID=UPI000B9A6554|nr:DUF6160 family protein [Hahella sp. CCB-MM4]OZG73488.1 hypothetical protein BTA51_10755 [Hahella sp. CCB-MM4]